MDSLVKKKYFTHLNKDGLLEVVCTETGKVLMVQNSINDIFEEQAKTATEITLADGRTLLVPRGFDVSQLTPGRVSNFKYSESMGDLISQRIAEGEKIGEICKTPGYPDYNIVRRWRQNNSSFDQKMKAAEAARADLFGDKLLDIAEEGARGNIDKETAAGYRIASENYSKMAEVGAPGKYGKNREATKITNNIVILTGVPKQEEILVKPITEEGLISEDKGEGLPPIEAWREDKD